MQGSVRPERGTGATEQAVESKVCHEQTTETGRGLLGDPRPCLGLTLSLLSLLNITRGNKPTLGSGVIATTT